jgi:SAM-dependent methyltransferase
VSGLLHAVLSGYYARNQLRSRSRLISWSHRGRFRTALRIARGVTGRRQLDYGCGDGTFLGLLATQQRISAVGAEVQASIVEDCRRRFAGFDDVRFELVSDLEQGAAASYDVIYCMEVLEHVLDPDLLLRRFDRLLAPGGTLVISVPIETGVPVVLKQIVRRIAGWRGIGHYPGTTEYSVRELVSSLLAGSVQHIERPVFTTATGGSFHDHKGFNWRVLRTLVRERFDLVHEDTSPVRALGPQLGTQRWFIARKPNR